MREIYLKAPISDHEIRSLRLGDIVFISGVIFTGREGLYRMAFDEKKEFPANLKEISNITFHCSPAVSQDGSGVYRIPSVTATASFRFEKYMERLFKQFGVRVVIGKGGMPEETYKKIFCKHSAIYLTTVGYGLGAVYGKGIRKVKDVYWENELGLAQAIWILDVERFGPFLVESDLKGNSLFTKANVEINKQLKGLYRDLPLPKLKRLGEITSPEDETI
jgi:L(+)-tartrate dehydratase beta subunit